MVMELVYPEERDLWLAAAASIEPRIPERPSVWARRVVRLSGEQTSRPGPYNPDVFPWSADLLDSLFDHPEKKGILARKLSQCGFSMSAMVLLLWMTRHTPGPMLYVTTDQPKTREFCQEYFVPIIRGSEELTALFDRAEEDDRSELKYHKPYRGGVVDFVSAGTESGLISMGRRVVILDEYQASSLLFARTGGNLWVAAQQRLSTWRDTSVLIAFSHPMYEGEDIDGLVRDLSDQGRWVFDCPLAGCGRVVEPHSSRLDFGAVGDAGDRDPDKAVFLCPHCTREITDAQRVRATWPARLGGTGRFQSPLDDAAARRREYLGRSVNGFANPHKTVREMARELVSAKTEGALVTQLNKGFGEARTQSRAVITMKVIDDAIKVPGAPGAAGFTVPGGPMGVRMFCTGADVQAPRWNPTMYVAGGAFAASGMLYITLLERVSGWTAYFELLRRAAVTVEGQGTMGVRLATIDAGWETKQVIENQREPVLYAAADSRVIDRLPVRYVPTLNEDNPAIVAPDRKRLHPTRPELGLVDYRYLHRHSWVDRALRRWQEGRVVVLCRIPADFRAHMMSNVLRPAPKQHGLDRDREQWERPDEFRDDWLQALAYLEAGAALKCGLDTIHAYAARTDEPATAPVEIVDGNYGSRSFGSGSFGRGRFT